MILPRYCHLHFVSRLYIKYPFLPYALVIVMFMLQSTKKKFPKKAADWAETWPKFKPPIRWPGHPSSLHWLGWGLFAKAVVSVVWKNGLAGGLQLSLTSVPGEAPRITLMLPHGQEGKSLCLPLELWLQSYTGQTDSRWVKYSTHKIFTKPFYCTCVGVSVHLLYMLLNYYCEKTVCSLPKYIWALTPKLW